MSKKFLYRLLGVLVLAAAAALWLLKALNVEGFEEFSVSWAGVIVAGGWGSLVLLSSFGRNDVTTKKLKVAFAVGLYIVMVVCLVGAIAIPSNVVLPIIACIVAAGLILSVIVTGGKKWDEADNHKVGYKNYYQRKAEEEKEAKKEDKE